MCNGERYSRTWGPVAFQSCGNAGVAPCVFRQGDAPNAPALTYVNAAWGEGGQTQPDGNVSTRAVRPASVRTG